MKKTVASILIAGIAAVALASAVTLMDGRVSADEPQEIEKEGRHLTPFAIKWGYSGEPFNLSPDLPEHDYDPRDTREWVMPYAARYGYSSDLQFHLSPDLPEHDYNPVTHKARVVPYTARYGYNSAQPFILSPDLPEHDYDPTDTREWVMPYAARYGYSSDLKFHLSPDLPERD